MVRTVTLSPTALKQLDEWRISNSKILVKIISLLSEIAANPFSGSGKPEPLKHELKGKWSRRITQEDRLVYEVRENAIWVISCKYHYE